MSIMTPAKKSPLVITAAILFLVPMIHFAYSAYMNLNYGGDLSSSTLSLIVYACAVVSLFLRRPLFLGISFSALALFRLFSFIGAIILIIDGYGTVYTILNFICFSAYSLIAVMFFTAKNGSTPLRAIWFLPAILVFISSVYCVSESIKFLIDVFESFYSYDRIYSLYILQDILYAVFCIAEFAAVLFVGLWIFTAFKKTQSPAQVQYPQQGYAAAPYANQQPYYAPQPVNPQYYYPAPQPAPVYNPAPQPVAGAMQSAPVDIEVELTKLKNLLDSGVITEEEFNAKKKQILGI